MDKIFKVVALILGVIFLLLYYMNSKQERKSHNEYGPKKNYEFVSYGGYSGAWDKETGTCYLLGKQHVIVNLVKGTMESKPAIRIGAMTPSPSTPPLKDEPIPNPFISTPTAALVAPDDRIDFVPMQITLRQ